MKVDKEFVIKYHFWILLGVYAPMVLVALVLLWTSVSGTVDAGTTALKATKDSLGKANGPNLKNPAWLAVMDTKEGRLSAQKNAMWQQVWDAQKVIFTWPSKLVAEFPELNNAYFLDKLSPRLRDKYVNDAGMYYSQLADLGTGIIHIVDPVNNRGQGTVQFKGGWESVLTFVARGKWPPIPDSDDCWLAQEDIWVQRELLYCVREANDFSANYKKQPNPPKPDKAKGEIDRQIFVNPRWKVDVTLTAKEFRWQVTNLSTRRLPLNMFLKVQRRGVSQFDDLWTDGEPLAPGESSKVLTYPFRSALVGLQSLDALKEDLDWRSAPVKRVDRLDLYHHSHRTNTKGFATPPVKVDPNAPVDPNAAAGGAGAVAGGPMGGMMNSGDAPAGPMGGMMGPMGGMMGQGGMQGMLVQKMRYLDINDQVRRMAVGVVLIVDQARIQDVLTAFANSRLRFQITQVHWQHYPGSIKPPVVADNKPVDFASQRGIPGLTRLAGGESDDTPRGFAGAMPSAPGLGQDASMYSLNVNDESANVVELAIYGIASLYQRYPPKAEAPADAAGSTPAAAGTPAAPAAPAAAKP